MRAKRTLRKKGFLLQLLAGLIIGVIMIIMVISIVKTLLTKNEDWEGSFREFAAKVQSVANGNIGEARVHLLKIKDKSAIIGISKKEIRGSLYDTGDFFYYGDSIIHGGTGVGHERSLTRFERPESCANDHSCICLCTGLSIEREEQPQEPAFEDYQKAFFHDIVCKKTQCIEIVGDIYPLSNENNYKYINPGGIQGAPGSQQVVLNDFDHFNGFAFHRRPTSPQGENELGYTVQLPASTPIHIEKLETGSIVACIDPRCADRSNLYERVAAINPDELNNLGDGVTGGIDAIPQGDPIYQEVTLSNGRVIQIGPSRMGCQAPEEYPSGNAQDVLDVIQSYAQQQFAQSYDLPLSEGNGQIGIEEDVFVRVSSQEHIISLQLLYKCAENSYQVLVGRDLLIEDDAVAYADVCGEEASYLFGAGDSILYRPEIVDRPSPFPPVVVTCIFT